MNSREKESEWRKRRRRAKSRVGRKRTKGLKGGRE